MKLKQLKPRIGSMPSRVSGFGSETQRTRMRDRVSAIRKEYKTARWQHLRWQVLQDALFTCARCGKAEANTARLVADHKEPHRGDPTLFWDRANLQCLCKTCHDSAKQAEERRMGMAGG